MPATFFEEVDIEKSGIDVPSYVSVAQTEDRWGNINRQGDYWSIDGPQLCLWSAPSAYNIYVSYSNDGGVGNNKSYSWDCGKVVLWVPEEADGVKFSIDTGIYQHYATSSMKLLDIGGYYSVGTFIPGLYSQITNIVLTGAAGNIPQYAFDGCKSLESIEIPDGYVIKAWQSEGWRFGANGVLRSAKIQDNQTSEMSLKLFGSGKLMFNWKASSEFYEDYSQGIHEVYDYAYLIVDGGPYGSLVEYKLDGIAIGGNTGWQAVELDIVGEGLHTVRWVYVKDEMDDPAAIGKDCIWVDDISFRPMTTVNFDIGDATGISPASVNAIYESKINMPEYSGFNKTKYSLVGWSDGYNIYEPNGAFQMKATNVTLKAVYEANTIATPIIESSSVVEGGVLEAAFAMINITCDAEATIHYTLDGSTPTAASAKYTGEFEALGLGEVTIKAIALCDNYFDSPVATFTYTRKPYTLAECLNVDGGLNVVSDAPAWFRVTGEVAHDGNEALRSGAIGANESSVVELMVNREGTVSFWWKVSSHDPRGRKYDHVAFFVDETEVAWISGEKDWENISYTITGSGTHTLKWTYKKNGDSYIAGEDCAWLDEVVWMGGARFDIAYENLKGATHQNPSSYYEGMNIKFTAPSAVDGYAFTGWTPPGITTSDTGNKVVTANWEWMPQDAVVDAFVTGAKPITIKADWVKTELEQKFGEGKEEAFIAKFGDDFAAALTKKTGKRDVEGNELLVWHDYVAGTDPTDIDSTFKAIIEMQDGKPVISWDPNLNCEGEERVYMVYGKENLSDIWHSPIAVLDHFFKVDVFMPYDVTVTLNAGAGASVDPISIRVGQPVGELPMPTREGYTFTGWFTAAEGGDAVTAETVVTADMTIYADWTIKSYTVAFNANGGVGDKSVTYNHGSPLGELPTPTREGYTFVGWFTAVEGGDAVTSETVVTSDMTIYAQWTINSYTVAFNANGGVGDKTVTYNHGSTLGELSTPTREGYTFAGWFTTAYGYDAVTSETIVASDMTIYAHWKIKYYRVAFETNSGVMSSLYAHGSTLGELTTPTREGYTFVGWFTAVEGGDAVTSETVVTSDMTIFAQWTIKSYTVVFNANGGVGDKSVTYNHGSPLGELPTPTRDGYAFAGWWTAANGRMQVTASTVVTSSQTLYARWDLEISDDAHDKVQLWENGPYWATTNIGAEKPEDYGYYFWWGDTIGYKRENDKWVASDGSNLNFSFSSGNTHTYGKNNSTLQSEGWITADGVLSPEHDAAHKHWGSDWRMPTNQEFDDLNSKCDWTWGSMNGVNGYVVRGRGDYSSVSIFLPCAGYGYETSLSLASSGGYYWSSVPDSGNDNAWFLVFGSGLHATDSYSSRDRGRSVRPVQVQYVSVKFDVGGGSTVNPIFVRVGQAVGELPTPTRDGYTFAGWWTAQEVGVAVTPETVVTVDMTIYARWEPFDGHDKVQLWEGGPYWATTNIGAEKPEDYGYYFWWGDTVGYKRENDKWVASDGSNSDFWFDWDTCLTYYKDNSTLQSEGWITADGVLSPEHDAAQKHWGGDWRMPTKQEFNDLNIKCDWTWTTLNGVNGYIVRGKGDYASNSIFLPCAGNGNGTWLIDAGSIGNYWSSVPFSFLDYYYVWCLSFDSSNSYTYEYDRNYGQSVRPVQVHYVSGKFDVGGGSSVNPISVRIGQAVGELPTPTRDGYTFAGWWTDQEGGVAVMPETVVTTDITIYARWKVEGLYAAYLFDGNLNDSYVHGYNLSGRSGSFVADRNGDADSAQYFDGNGKTVTTADCRVEAEFTFAFWCKTSVSMSETGSGDDLGSWSGNYILFPRNSQSDAGFGVKVGMDGISVMGHGDFYLQEQLGYSANIGTGWNHIAVSVSSEGTIGIYLNGVCVKTGTKPSSRKSVFVPEVGGGPYGYYTGCIDELLVFDKALDEDTIASIYRENIVFQADPLYCVIDLSAGENAASYPVTYLSDVPAGGWTDEYKTTKLVLRRIEPGSFKMNGSYDVTITKAFYCGVFEVTQKQYELVTGSKPSNFSGDKLPVEQVSWNMIRGNSDTYNWPTIKTVDPNSFIGRIQARTGLNFDLPTEAQWEYACRAGTTTTYYWGNSMDGTYAWYSSNSSSTTHMVGTRTPNAWGLYDMSGNVWELCLDWFGNLSSAENPNGSSSGLSRVIRGECFASYAADCNSSVRDDFKPSDISLALGFRLVGNLSE